MIDKYIIFYYIIHICVYTCVWASRSSPPPSPLEYIKLKGTGFLTLPFATAKAGALLGLLGLAVMTLLANTAKDYVLEASARAELLDHPSSYPELGLQLNAAGGGGGGHGNGNGNGMSRQESSQNLPLMLTCKSVRYEMPVLCRKFLGPWGRLAYMLCLSVYIYGALLAYTSVFAKSCASTFPLPGVGDSYAVYLAVFALLVVPLSCLELTEQVAIQVVLAGCRVLLVVLMVGTVGAAYGSKAESFPGQSGESPRVYFIRSLTRYPNSTLIQRVHTATTKPKPNPPGPAGIPLWDVGGLYVFLPIACYAFIYHHSIAGLSHPVRDKKLLGSIFLTTFLICAVAYGAIAVLVASYFGPGMAQSSNLEWRDYGAGGGGFKRVLAFYILLFPALDVASAFPLNAITLGNNLIAMRDEKKPGVGAAAAAIGSSRPGRRTVVAFRLLAAVPPIIAGFFVRELGRISEWCGTVGIVITLVFPAVLNLKSRQVLKEVFALDSAKTYYSNELSRKRYGPVNLLIGVALFVYILVNLALGKE